MDEELDPSIAEQPEEDYGAQLNDMAANYDLSGVTSAFDRVTSSAEKTRAALQAARQRIMDRKFDRTQALFALSAGLLSPTQTGNFFESFGNMSRNLIEPIKEKRQFELQRDKDLMGIDTGIAGIDDSLAKSALSLESLKAKMAAQAALAAAKEPNEKVIIDGKRRLVRQSKARGMEFFVPPTAGTNVSINTGKNLYETLADKQAAEYAKMYGAARAAPKMIERANDIRSLLQKNTYTGSLADFKLALGKGLQSIGVNYADDAATNTEQLMVRMARGALEAIDSSGLAGSQGLTEGERKFLERAVAGEVTLEPQTILDLANINEKVARRAAEAWNEQYDDLDPNQLKTIGMKRIEIGSGAQPRVFKLNELPPTSSSTPATQLQAPTPGQPRIVPLNELPQ